MYCAIYYNLRSQSCRLTFFCLLVGAGGMPGRATLGPGVRLRRPVPELGVHDVLVDELVDGPVSGLQVPVLALAHCTHHAPTKRGVYDSWKSPGMYLMLPENFIFSNVISTRFLVHCT